MLQEQIQARTLVHAHAHARAVQTRSLSLPPDGLPPVVILDSWARCLDSGLAPNARVTVPVVLAADLAQRRERSALVRRLAQAELETLSQQIAGSNFLLAFADCEGVILDLYADNRFKLSGGDTPILPGSCWTEGVAGTNGLGTALATGAAVAVTGLEHYFLSLGDISCTATPVHDARGAVVGVLDASSFYESRQRHTQALVQMAATHIENGLLVQQMRGQLVLAIHPRAEFLGTPSAGLVAFDGDGRLQALNARASSLLVGLDARLGCAFEALFDETFEQLLARLHHGHEVRLHDSLGSALATRVVGNLVGIYVGHPASRPHAVPQTAPESALRHLRQPHQPRPAHPTPRVHFLADDPAVAEACRLVEAAVRLRVPVLLHGETGTGKELLARHAHQASGRTGGFVALNCAALPRELFEAELFGYTGGAYTGARREGSAGLLVAAHGGTLLLDEVAELPLSMQAALLRFLDDQSVRAVGSSSTRQVDVQLLAASHTDLATAVMAKQFRDDLLFRLNTVCVTLPPLRQRRDLAQAVVWVLGQVDEQASITDAAIQRLMQHPWPGNFRELRSMLTRALLARRPARRGGLLDLAEVQAVLPQTCAVSTSMLQRSADDLVRHEFERCGRSVSRTSRSLGISRTTVYRHLRA